MRVPPGLGQDLAAVLDRFGHELCQAEGIEFESIVEGATRDLTPEVLREAALIGREALLNAAHHGKPRSIELQIAFKDDMLQMSVRDDGRGFDEKSLSQPPGGRHWGLAGMKERAISMSSTISIRSRQGLGTEVELCVPSQVAYMQGAAKTRWQGLRRAFGYKR
jgi:signal transduction histidine kinase